MRPYAIEKRSKYEPKEPWPEIQRKACLLALLHAVRKKLNLSVMR